MSIKIGQYRKKENIQYISAFDNPILVSKDNNKLIFQIKDLDISQPYYFKIKIKTKKTNQIINFKLQEILNNDNPIQRLGQYKIKSENIENFETILIPNFSQYHFLICESTQKLNEDDIEIEIYSILNVLNNLNGVTTLNKIGIQAKPNQLVCINGEPIRIGKSGLYELNNLNIEINFIGFIDIGNNFILDYQY